MRLLYRHFRGTFKSWPALFQEAADFATSVGRDALVNISHSAEGAEGIVTVWYWGEPTECPGCGYNLTGNQSGRCPECGLAV
jgi:predicted Zn-ribbon and HTH transcriptional regulator